MRRLAGVVDLSDTLCVLGVVCMAVTVYLLWSVWVFAFVGVALVVAGIMRDVGRERGGGASGTRR